MPLRKSHLKSRFGCQPCRKRHIKCGEEAPFCQKCINRRVECVYQPAEVRVSVPISSDSASRVASPASLHVTDEVRPTRMQELHLMAHYTTSTCYTMSHTTEDGTSDIEIWQKAIPEEAFHHEFLIDGILALSALHYASENSDSRWGHTRMATLYQTSALRGYQDALQNITNNNHNAIFAYAVILNVLSLAFPNVCAEPASASHAESIIALIELVQGTGHITATNDVSLRSGKFAAFFGMIPWRDPPPAPDPAVAEALDQLRERVESIRDLSDNSRYKAYTSGIDALEISFGRMAAFQHTGHVMVWTTMVSKDLVSLFKNGDAMARLVFVHYGVLLLEARERWWARDTGKGLIKNLVNDILKEKPEWEGWTNWTVRRAEGLEG
jgi:hypothetical protein